jgi:hypothetical protein
MSNASTSLLRRLVLLGTPLAFAAVTLLHPMASPDEPSLAVGRWWTVHLLQIPLTILLAYGIWILLDGLRSTAATIARAALPVFLVCFSAYDAVAGLATGWLAQAAGEQSGAEQLATQAAIGELFNDNWLAGNFSVLGSASAVAWAVVAVAGALALRRAGADGLTVGLMALSLVFLNHPAPTDTIGMLALFGAAFLWDRHRRKVDPRTSDTPAPAPAAQR